MTPAGDDRDREARRIIDRVSKETAAGDTAAGMARAHDSDPIEELGTRIGRALGTVLTIIIVAWLVYYVVGG